MGKVISHMTMSLDGFVADPNDNPGELFDWYEAGDVTVPNPNPDVTFKVDEASAEVLRELTEDCGAVVAGRRLFDMTDGWGDNTLRARRWWWSRMSPQKTLRTSGPRRRS